MILKSLELLGFKTFPEKTVLKFKKGISVVVGPNGSGKSNVSDAIRWVLGEQSLRLLRCSKMEDVVFNGTVDRKSKGYAEVSLVIENKDRRLNLEKDEVVLTRRYYRSTESEYLLNNEQVRLKDINELFMDTGLGRDGYSIIGQGKIDEIVSSKSEDRREIFEEAAGISKYRYRKSEAEKKLVKTEENLVRINDILGELKDRVGPLFKESEKAKEYLKLAKEQKDIQIGLWLNDLENFSSNLSELKSKQEIAKQQYSEIEKNLEETIQFSEKAREQINELNIKIDLETRKNSVFEENKAEKTNKISILENDISHDHSRIESIVSEINGITSSFSDSKEKKEALLDKINSLQKSNELKEKELLKYKNENTRVTNEISNISVEITDLNKAILEINNKDALDKAREITSEEYIRDSEEKLLKIEKDIKSKNDELEILLKKFEEIETNVKESEESLSEKIELMTKAKKDLTSKQKEVELLREDINKLKLENESKIRKAEFLKNLEENLEGFSFSIKFVMKESKAGRLFGIFGPVISLLKVQDRYSLAIETALGPSSQYIVTKTEQDAKAAINTLKEKKAGRATFLPVSNISGRKLEESSLQNCAGFVGIASDLCEFDDKFKNIFYYLTGRIVIADALNNASVIAKKFSYKYRIVTLDGQVINAGGSLTGGSASKNLGVLQRNKEINLLEAETRKSKVYLDSKKEELKRLLAEQENLKNTLKIVEDDIYSKNQKNIKLKTDHNNCSYEVRSARKNLEDLRTDQEKIKNKIEELKNASEKAKVSKRENKDQLRLLEEQLEQLNVKINVETKKKESLNNSINKYNLDILTIVKDLELNNNSLKVLVDSEVNGESKVKNLKEEKNLLEKDIVEKKELISKFKEEIDKDLNDFSNLEKSINELGKKRISLEKEVTDLRNKEREITRLKEGMSLECARFEDKIENLQKNYDEIVGKMWDEYEITKTEAIKGFKKIEETSKYNKILAQLKLKIRNLGNVNLAAVEEYREVNERYTFLKHQVEDVEKSKRELNKLISELINQMKDLFKSKFATINENFNKVFKELFGGGKAELSMVNEEDILNTGINIYVQPPGKIVSHIESLSGGEKALVAISIYFAIMLVNPVPFCVLDEIEAALDDVNVRRFAFYLRKMSEKTQFIVITHRRGTMEQADTMYGVTMQQKGVSKLLELDLQDARVNFNL